MSPIIQPPSSNPRGTTRPIPVPALPKRNGCYICQPDNPDAAEEGCETCDREHWSAYLKAVARLANVTPEDMRRTGAIEEADQW